MKRTTLAIAMALVLAGTSLGMASASNETAQPVGSCAPASYVIAPGGAEQSRLLAPEQFEIGAVSVVEGFPMHLTVSLQDGIPDIADGMNVKVFYADAQTTCSSQPVCDFDLTATGDDDQCTLDAPTDRAYFVKAESLEVLDDPNVLRYTVALDI